MSRPPDVSSVAALLDGPHRDGCEQRWRVRLADGSNAVLSELLPELARDEATRRRYVNDVERVRALDASSVARVVAVGPSPDPLDPTAAPPWRLRAEPAGTLLEDWLRDHAPAPFPEVQALAAGLADALHAVHTRGGVLRDLHPRRVVLGPPITFTDVGLARTDILSSRTAASLVLEGSPYAAPEHAARTTVDARADLFTCGVILWRAITGTLPYGDGPAFLAEGRGLPDLAAIRPDVPERLAAVVGRCLAWTPDARPGSARELAAILRGETDATGTALVRLACQVCGASLRDGLRMCLSCGRVPIRFTPTALDASARVVVLTAVSEDAAFVGGLRALLDPIAETPVRSLRFMTGHQKMYSKAELERVITLPIKITGPVSEDSAVELQTRLKALGAKADAWNPIERARKARSSGAMIGFSMFGFFLSIAFLIAGKGLVGIPFMLVAILGFILSLAARSRNVDRIKTPPLLTLRPAPAMVPPSDALTAKLAAVVGTTAPADVREILADVAISVQSLVDLRATGDLTLVLPTADRLVDLVCAETRALTTTDAALATLDEGTLVRALAASEARREPRSSRAELLDALDRLRTLEDERTRRIGRLLDAAGLLRRALAVALADPARTDAAEVALALTALEPT